MSENPKTTKDWVIFTIKNASMIVVLLGALWNYGEIGYDFFTGTNKAERQELELQLSLWRKNKQCLKNKPQSFETDKKEIIQLLLCKNTSSLLIEIIPPDENLSTTKWIELRSTKEEKSSFIFFDELMAQDIRKMDNHLPEFCRFVHNDILYIVRRISERCVVYETNLNNGYKKNYIINCDFFCQDKPNWVKEK